jgi:hypothetical protein
VSKVGVDDFLRACTVADLEALAVAPPTPAATALPFRTARQLAATTADEVAWIVKPWAARGAITELDGKIKASGKTTLLTKMCRAVLDGAPFLGQPTTGGPVVYLTEQAAASVRPALKRADLLDRDDFHVLCWPELGGLPWATVAVQTVAYADEVGAVLLVVDTLGQFSGVSGDAENDSGRAMEVMAPLQRATATTGLAIIVARHDRKSGGEVGESGRGSSAYSGTVETIVQLGRIAGDAVRGERVRLLRSLSRFDEVPSQLVIELDADGEYVVCGDEAAYARAAAEPKVLAALPTAAAEALPATVVEARVGISHRLVGEALAALAAAGRVQREGEGKRGRPYRYWRPAPADSVTVPPLVFGVVTESNGAGGARGDAEAAAANSVTTHGDVTEWNRRLPVDSVTTPNIGEGTVTESGANGRAHSADPDDDYRALAEAHAAAEDEATSNA